MLKLKLQYFGHLIWRVNSLEETQMLGKMKAKGEGAAEEDQMVNGITDSTDTNLSKLWKKVKNRGAWCAVVCGVSKIQMQLSDWTTSLTDTIIISSHFTGEESAPSPTISGSLKVLPLVHLFGSFKTHLKCKRFNSTGKQYVLSTDWVQVSERYYPEEGTTSVLIWFTALTLWSFTSPKYLGIREHSFAPQWDHKLTEQMYSLS